MRDLMERAKQISSSAYRAYRERRVTLRERVMERETESEIRAALREMLGEHDLGSAAFD